jgi:hypothetical protein
MHKNGFLGDFGSHLFFVSPEEYQQRSETMVKDRKPKILTAVGVMVLVISACRSIPVSVPSTAEATPPATVNVPLTTPEAGATEVVVTPPVVEVTPSEAVALTPTETTTPVDMPIVFSENFRNQGEGITFQVSDGARAIAETIYDGPIESIVVDPAALTALKNGLIERIRDIYINIQSIEWNGRVEFIAPSRDEVTRNGSQIVVNSDPSKHWDTSQPLNLFVVTDDEIIRIRDDYVSNHPEMDYVYTGSAGDRLLLFTDPGTMATYVYGSVDWLLTEEENLSYTSPSLDISLLTVVSPLVSFHMRVNEVSISIGKNVGFSFASVWMYETLGCDSNNIATTNCVAVTIR